MDAYEYAEFVQMTARNLYRELGRMPVFGSYIHTDYHGDKIISPAFLHPDDYPDNKFKEESELKYPFRDL